jgi:DNA (cytosine-5)-methyltransferase 1
MGTAASQSELAPITFGSLFSGIGGMDLGLERAGMVCKWQVEINPFCQRVLAKHWPNVKRHDDITKLTGEELAPVDCIAGGFPCQDISSSGKKVGITGRKSGLWKDMARIVRHVRPRFIIVENVSAILARGVSTVLGDLAESGYDAEWQCLPVAAFSLPHIRERIFILGYANGYRKPTLPFNDEAPWLPPILLNTKCDVGPQLRKVGRIRREGEPVPWVTGRQDGYQPRALGVDDEPPYRLDRLRGIGNSVAPDVAEWIGRRVIAASINANNGEARK